MTEALIALVVFVGGALVAYFKGRGDAKDKRTQDNLDAAKKAKDTRYELENSDDQRLVDILSGKLRDR